MIYLEILAARHKSTSKRRNKHESLCTTLRRNHFQFEIQRVFPSFQFLDITDSQRHIRDPPKEEDSKDVPFVSVQKKNPLIKVRASAHH